MNLLMNLTDSGVSIVAGRGRANAHVRRNPQEDGDVAVIQCDFQFWTPEGAKSAGPESPGMAKSLTMVDKKTGAPCASCVLSKGGSPYVVEAASHYIMQLGYAQVILQCDAEPAIIFLMKKIQKNCKCVIKVRWSARYSKASNGEAEGVHNLIAGQVKTLLDHVSSKLGVGVSVGHPLFPWAVRHAAWLQARYAKSKTGSTPYHAARGKEYKSAVVQFAEAVHYRIADLLSQPKALPRWYKRIWVGKSEGSDEHLIMTDAGVITPKNVKRLVEGAMWDKELVSSGVGLPWALKEGAVSVRAPRVISGGVALPVPSEGIANPSGPSKEPAPRTPEKSMAAPGTPMETSSDSGSSSSDSSGEEADASKLAAFVVKRIVNFSPEKQAKRLRPEGQNMVISGVVDMPDLEISAEAKLDARVAELKKLDDFTCFEPVEWTDTLKGKQIFGFTWVDKMKMGEAKSRFCDGLQG